MPNKTEPAWCWIYALAGEKPSTDYTALGRLAAFEESGVAYSDLASPEISRLSAAIRIAASLRKRMP